jgi:hypothetical protein
MYRVSTVARRIDAISRSPAAQRHIAEETMRLLEPIRQRLLNKRPYMLAGELIRAVQGLNKPSSRMLMVGDAIGAEQTIIAHAYGRRRDVSRLYRGAPNRCHIPIACRAAAHC